MAKPLSRAIIERAYSLITDETDWCRGALARDERGKNVDPTDVTARQRCAFGALIAAAYELVNDLGQAHDLAASTTQWGHAAVSALFDKALAAD
jgi:hypothetical protein